MNVIEIKNLTKIYNISINERYTFRDRISSFFLSLFKRMKSEGNFFALKDVNIKVRKGEIMGLIGANGAGKSTLLKVLSNITSPDDGEIKITGKVASLLEVGTGFHSELTGRENIYLNGSILGMKKNEIETKIEEIIDFSGVKNFIDVPIKKYSSGMYVRLAFSVAAHLEPDILLVDEVLAVGDARFQKKCLGKMDEVTKKSGRTIIFVSHDLEAVKSICTRCVLLENGEVKKIGKTDDVIRTYLEGDYINNKINKDRKLVRPVEVKNNIQIDDAFFLSFNNEKKTVLNFQEPFKVSLVIKKRVNNFNSLLSFFVLVYNQEHRVVLSSFQKDMNTAIDFSDEKKVFVDFNPNILSPGEYYLSAGAFDSQGVFEEWVDGLAHFSIANRKKSGEKFDERLGQVSIKYKWYAK